MSAVPLPAEGAPDWSALLLTLKLASVTVALLLLVGLPLAWWLSQTRWRVKPILEAVFALPLVLPPTVLGFYLLLLMGPQGTLGALWVALTGHALVFSFAGLVIASVFYSLPFAVQPLQAAFSGVGREQIESARLLGAAPPTVFWRVVLPQARRGVITAAVLAFAHTLGEFGVVLMVGGNIPHETRVVSVALYEAVERLDYGAAHRLSLVLLALAFGLLLIVYGLDARVGVRLSGLRSAQT